MFLSGLQKAVAPTQESQLYYQIFKTLVIQLLNTAIAKINVQLNKVH